MSHDNMSHRITYEKVLLATFCLSDDIGLLCRATDAELARTSGRSLQSVRKSLDEMKRRGLVEILDYRHGLSRRIVVLLDRPGGRVFVDHFNWRQPRLPFVLK